MYLGLTLVSSVPRLDYSFGLLLFSSPLDIVGRSKTPACRMIALCLACVIPVCWCFDPACVFLKNCKWIRTSCSRSSCYADFISHNWDVNQHIRVISEGSCDWSNDAKQFSFEITGIRYILKYIPIENIILNSKNIFKKFSFFPGSNKCRLGEHI